MGLVLLIVLILLFGWGIATLGLQQIVGLSTFRDPGFDLGRAAHSRAARLCPSDFLIPFPFLAFQLEELLMRYAFTLLATTVVILLATTSNAFAQRGGRSNSGHAGYPGNSGNRGYSSPYRYNTPHYGYSNYGYSNYGRTGFGVQIYNSGYNNFGYNRSLYGSSYSYYTPNYIAPTYYQPAPYYSVMPTTYSEVPLALNMPAGPQNPNDDSLATIMVTVPTSDAQVWFGETLMTQTGTVRTFQSTPLDLDKNYSYAVRARWMSKGVPIDQIRKVDIRAGQVSKVDFLSPKPETVPAPQPIIK